jgi:hypothetical protein
LFINDKEIKSKMNNGNMAEIAENTWIINNMTLHNTSQRKTSRYLKMY